MWLKAHLIRNPRPGLFGFCYILLRNSTPRLLEADMPRFEILAPSLISCMIKDTYLILVLLSSLFSKVGIVTLHLPDYFVDYLSGSIVRDI